MSVTVDNVRQQLRGGMKSRNSEVRADLATFFGPNAEPYLNVYERMRVAPNGTRSWSWPVFFGSFTWFFYRKMYGIGAIIIFLPLLATYLFGSASSAMGIIFA